MMVMKTLKFAIASFVLVLFAAPALAALSVDEFIPPVQASSEAERVEQLKVREPGEVKEVEGEITEEPAISAKSAQDAINAWVAKRASGAVEVVFPSGFGFVSTGTGTYEKHENPVAARISKRGAYARAYMSAKSQLAEKLNGVLNKGKTEAFARMATVNESLGQTLVNMEEVTTEAIRQRVDGFLRGYVVYDVFDDVAGTRVYLTIVTTPKTQGHYDRPDPSSLSAVSVQEGLAQVFAEIEQGLTPPVGGRTVFVPATGELAFVGFGSTVVGRHDNSAVQARLELNAEQIAKMRAKDSLCGVIVGEEIAAAEKLDAEVGSMTKDFEELSKDDPAVRNDPEHPGYVKLRNRKTEFKAADVYKSVITGAREGVLPPGVQQQSWLDEDKAFAYAVAVYLPSVTEQAAAGAETMKSGTILRPVGEKPETIPVEIPTKTPKEDVKQGPSGTVQKTDGL
ncbi:MAG: hypothetical protein LBQ42_13845 [Synergistaceae bacterium]|jgi:hypothetical protein|nr:hypothetical protein [Synergistaceae bacterium]